MTRISLFLLAFVACISACRQPAAKTTLPRFLSRDSLPVQLLSIDNTRDTVVRTANGALLHIPEGAFTRPQVTLRVKEAYTLPQMVLAGLTTESGGKPLKSGGMIFLGTVEENIGINKEIGISIPTDSVDRDMKLYTGKEEGGKLDWQDPKALDTGSDLSFEEGRRIFEANCSSCHALDKVLSGPPLAGVEQRGPWGRRDWLFSFVRHPGAFIPRTCYTRQLQKQYGQIMPGFPQLDDRTLSAVFDYIRSENRKNGDTITSLTYSLCDDSCYRYDSVIHVMENELLERNHKIAGNGSRIDLERNFPTPDFQPEEIDTTGYIPDTVEMDKVTPVDYGAQYYRFQINTFGWYNVDALLESGGDARLIVDIQGPNRRNTSVFLIVPQDKVFTEGGPLKDPDSLFGFFTRDGKIPLPEGRQCIVMAVSEEGGKIYFASQSIVSAKDQRIVLEPKEVSKRQFNRAVHKFRLDKVSIQVEDTPDADAIRKLDNQIKVSSDLLEQYRPKNCDCECSGERYPAVGTDSTSTKTTAATTPKY